MFSCLLIRDLLFVVYFCYLEQFFLWIIKKQHSFKKNRNLVHGFCIFSHHNISISLRRHSRTRWGLRICINITFFFWWVGRATSNLDPCYQGGKLQLKLSSIERVSRTNFRPSQWTRVIDRLTEEYRLLLSLVAGTYHSLVAQTVTWCIK